MLNTIYVEKAIEKIIISDDKHLCVCVCVCACVRTRTNARPRVYRFV